MGKVTHYLGLKLQWKTTPTSVSVHLSQETFTPNLVHDAGLDNSSSTYKPTPFRSVYPVDSIHSQNLPPEQKEIYKKQLQSFVGSLLWLSQSTRPDLSVITAILAQHQKKP